MNEAVERAKCLVVEDHPAQLAALAEALRKPDREIFTATSAAEAMNLSREHDFAFVLLDLQIPTLDGHALAEMMRGAERSSSTPIVFMSAAGPQVPLPVFRGFDAAAVDVLFKPVNPMILEQKAKLFFELYRQKQELARALKAREDVLAIVSHDMRTPLSVVATTASMLLNPKYQLSPQQVRDQYERIKRNVDLMNRMIGDLLDMANLRAGKLSIEPKPMIINEVLRDAVATHEAPAREKGVTLAYDAGTDVMRAQADRARLTQLFHNLIGNAIKFCKSGDRITVVSRTRGGTALIEISDTGPGIAPEDLPHIFDPYYSASRKHEKTGTGLGLYIGKGIVDAHGGQIRCGSQPGVGTTFSITLPLAAEAPAAASAAQ
ncbi:MAG TPA: hybrid sensor histidine kinase/response regulator [Steroidobacteraceae bacterium]|nr:hybrid sensor histidine kinase/response regulator [Steroidobacteraceae bacterium]